MESRGDVTAEGPVGQCGLGHRDEWTDKGRTAVCWGSTIGGEGSCRAHRLSQPQAHAITTTKLGWTRPTRAGTAHAVPNGPEAVTEIHEEYAWTGI